MGVSKQIREGGCRCGAIRFGVEAEPRFVGACHCKECRRSSGAAFSTFVGFRSEQIIWSGDERQLFESSPGVRRGVCGQCGTPLSYQGEKWAGETHLFIGTFDEPALFTPSGSVFEHEALPWCKDQ